MTIINTGVFTAPTSTGTKTISGLDFMPQCVLIWSSSLTSETLSTTLHFSFGAFDAFGNQFTNGMYSQNNALNTNTRRGSRNDKCISIFFSGAVVCEAEFDSVADGEFTLDFTTVDSARRFSYMAIGNTQGAKVGSFLSSTSTGNQDITTVGFEPDTLILSSIAYQSVNNIWNDIYYLLGFADNNLNQESVSFFANDNELTSDTLRSYSQDNIIYRITDGGSIPDEAELTAYLSNGFRLNWIDPSATPYYKFYIALKGVESFVGSTTQRTTIGENTITGVGFEADGLLTLMLGSTVAPDSLTTVIVGMGAGDSVSNQSVEAGYDRNGRSFPDIVTGRYSNASHIYAAPFNSGVFTSASLSEINSDGFKLDFDVVDANARYIPFLAMKQADPPTQNIHQTYVII